VTSKADQPEQTLSSSNLSGTSQTVPLRQGAPTVGQSLRNQAEVILRKAAAFSPDYIEALSPEETRRIIHELQVHQIEIEMQNEELHRTQAQLAIERDRYFDLYDLAPIGYCTLSEQGVIIAANHTASTLLGVARGALVTQLISRFILKEDQDLWYLNRDQLTKTGKPQVCELRMVREDAIFWANLASTVTCDINGVTVFKTILSDISARKYSEEAMRASEIQYRHLFENAPLGIFRASLDGKPLAINAEMARIYGCNTSEEALRDFTDLAKQFYVEPQRRREFISLLKKNGMVNHFEYEGRKKNGEPIWVSMNAKLTAVEETNGPLGEQVIDGFAIDITERKRNDEEIKRNELRLKKLVEVLQHPSETVQDFLDYALEQALQLTESKMGYIFHYHEVQKELVLSSWSKEALPACAVAKPQTCYELDKTGIWGEAVRQRRPLVINDFQATHPLEKGYPVGHVQLLKFVTIPIFKGEDIVSVVSLANKATDYDQTDILQVSFLMDAAWKVIENMQAQEALRESAQEYRTLADSGQALIWTASTDKLCNYFNNVWLEFTGRSFAQERGNGWLAGVHPADMQHCLDIYTGAFDRQEKFNMVYRLRRSDGEYRWLLDEGCPRYDSKGTFIGYIGHCLDITELKHAETALRESEATVRKRLEIILEPEGDIGTLELADIIDAPALQAMLEHFHRITNIGGGVAILDIRGNVLVAVGWQDICTKFHRVHPLTSKNCKESDTVLSGGIPAGVSKAYRCKNNLWDIATPIMIGNRHLGNVFVGQFFYDDEVIDIERFRRQAQQYGFNEKEYLAALDRIPRWSRESVDAAMSFYGSLAKMISSLSYSTIKLSRALSQKDVALYQLDESKAFQTSLLETMPIPVYHKDTAGRYLGFNKAFEDFYGKSKDHLIGKSVFDIYPQELAQIYFDQDAELFKKQRSQVYESKIPDSHGTLHDVIFHKASLVDSQGVIIGLVGAIVDVTERNRTEEEKKNLEKQLVQAQKMEAIGTLAGGIAHDFNNILGAVIGFTEIAIDSLPPGSGAIKSLEKVMVAGFRASSLVKQILTFSRQSVTERIPLQPAIIIKEALKILRPSLPSTITIKQQIDSATKPILADPTEIHQILMNLCTNAFHAMEQTGGILDITLKDSELSQEDLYDQPDVRSGNFAVLSIRDSGAGIPLEIREKIFDPYFTTKEAGKGTGLGLAIVHGITRKYGGFISCESTLGKGTVFHVFFPTIEEKFNDTTNAVETIQCGKERILFIDDEEILVELGKTMLEHLGYKVTGETNSLEALNLFQNQPDQFDVVITDQTMPGMTGIELARRMLQVRPGFPIILCTGYSNLVNEEQAKSCGVKGFAMKPLTKKDISALLRKVLEARSLS